MEEYISPVTEKLALYTKEKDVLLYNEIFPMSKVFWGNEEVQEWQMSTWFCFHHALTFKLFFSFLLYENSNHSFLVSAFAVSSSLAIAMGMNSKKHPMNSKQHPTSLLCGLSYHCASFISMTMWIQSYTQSQKGKHL